MGKYGVNTAEVEKIIEKVKTITPEQLKQLETSWCHIPTPKIDSRRAKAQHKAYKAIGKTSQFHKWFDVQSAFKVAYDESVANGFSYPLWEAGTQICIAYFAFNRISTRTFNILSEAWREVMEVENG